MSVLTIFFDYFFILSSGCTKNFYYFCNLEKSQMQKSFFSEQPVFPIDRLRTKSTRRRAGAFLIYSVLLFLGKLSCAFNKRYETLVSADGIEPFPAALRRHSVIHIAGRKIVRPLAADVFSSVRKNDNARCRNQLYPSEKVL